MIYLNDDYVRSTLRKRNFDAHKGDFGKVLVFAGSVGMAGAAVLCAKAALRSGSGLVRFLLPDLASPLYNVLQCSVPEATCVEFKKYLDLNEYDSIACGPGLGKSEASKDILKYILTSYGSDRTSEKRVIVLDADALNLISEDEGLRSLVKASPAEIMITPHVGETKRLLNSCAGAESLSGRKNMVADLAETYSCIAILKGAGTLIAAPMSKGFSADRNTFENTTGNPGMATGGSGDVLTGIIASLAGQGYTSLDAAKLGVFIHGKAGDIAAERLGEMSLTASDIIEALPDALKLYYPVS